MVKVTRTLADLGTEAKIAEVERSLKDFIEEMKRIQELDLSLDPNNEELAEAVREVYALRVDHYGSLGKDYFGVYIEYAGSDPVREDLTLTFMQLACAGVLARGEE